MTTTLTTAPAPGTSRGVPTSPPRTLSGLKPTGSLQLGNLLSAVRPLARLPART